MVIALTSVEQFQSVGRRVLYRLVRFAKELIWGLGCPAPPQARRPSGTLRSRPELDGRLLGVPTGAFGKGVEHRDLPSHSDVFPKAFAMLSVGEHGDEVLRGGLLPALRFACKRAESVIA